MHSAQHAATQLAGAVWSGSLATAVLGSSVPHCAAGWGWGGGGGGGGGGGKPQPWMVRLRVRVSHETLTCAKRRRYTTSLPSSASPAGGPSGFSKSGDHRSAMLAAFNVQPPYPKYLCGCQSAPTWSVHEPPPPPDRNHDDAPLPPLPLPLLLPPPLPPRLCRPPRSTHGWRSYVRPMAGTDQESGD